MMIIILIAIIVILLAMNIALWKFGFVEESENPQPVDDRPIRDPRQRKALMKRLDRWKKEGKISALEYDNIMQLCDKDWDPA